MPSGRRVKAQVWRLSGTFALALATVVAVGCFDPIERATKNIQNGAESISKGMSDLSKLDPIALNKLLKENEELRQTAELLRKKLQEVDGVASVHVGQGSEVIFEITGYKGRLRLSGWVDNERNKFIDNRVLLLIEKPFVLDRSWSYISGWYAPLPYQEKDVKMAEVAQASFDKYLADPFVPPSTDMRLHSVDRRFLSSGQHSILLQVTPEALDKNGQWELEYKMYVQTPAKQAVVTTGRMDSQTSKGELGKPLTPHEVAFATVTVDLEKAEAH